MSYHQDVIDEARRLLAPDEFERLMCYGLANRVVLEAGQRVITHQPLAEDFRWQGTVVGDEQKREWNYGTVERVIDAMNKDLGEVPESSYRVVES